MFEIAIAVIAAISVSIFLVHAVEAYLPLGSYLGARDRSPAGFSNRHDL
jgi:hypothetical protein